MKHRRTALALVLAVAGLIAPAAAAAKGSCRLVVDATGDVDQVRLSQLGRTVVTPAVDAAALDIHSADIASDGRSITAVVRVRQLARAEEPVGTGGLYWTFGFVAGGTPFTFTAQSAQDGTITYQASYADSLGHIYDSTLRGAFDVRRNEVRMTAPVSLLADQARIARGVSLSELQATTGRAAAVGNPSGRPELGANTLQVQVAASDEATSPRHYVVGSPSCVVPGV